MWHTSTHRPGGQTRNFANLRRAAAMSAPHSLSRREFLGLSGLIVSFALPLPPASAGSSQQTKLPIEQKTIAPSEVDGFLAIDRQGNITVFSGKVDLGTGVRTAITQIVAEE